jgi:hypothetical protein
MMRRIVPIPLVTPDDFQATVDRFDLHHLSLSIALSSIIPSMSAERGSDESCFDAEV